MEVKRNDQFHPSYKRELRRSILTLVIFGAVMTLYISIIVGMYNPEMMQSLEEMRKMLPELMSAVGMKAGANLIIGFHVFLPLWFYF